MTKTISIEDTLFTREWNPGVENMVVQNNTTHIYGHAGQYAYGSAAPAFTNDTQETIRLVQVNIWMGLGYNAYADLITKVFRLSDGMLMGWYSQDRYANSGDASMVECNFRPEGFEIIPGEQIVVHCLNSRVGGDDSPMLPVVLFYFAKSKPVP